MTAMSRKFVIHLHSGYGAEHYDLMLQQGAALATWQLSGCPGGLSVGSSTPARKIHDHRLAYLDYEGPVSRDRGSVARWDRGDCEVLEQDEARRRVRFHGERLRGLFELTRDDPRSDQWTLRRLRIENLSVTQ